MKHKFALWFEPLTLQDRATSPYLAPNCLGYDTHYRAARIFRGYLLPWQVHQIRYLLTTWSLTKPERGFEPGSAGYKATALLFEPSIVDLVNTYLLGIVSTTGIGPGNWTKKVLSGTRKLMKLKIEPTLLILHLKIRLDMCQAGPTS
jgi:hypothetical protein